MGPTWVCTLYIALFSCVDALVATGCDKLPLNGCLRNPEHCQWYYGVGDGKCGPLCHIRPTDTCTTGTAGAYCFVMNDKCHQMCSTYSRYPNCMDNPVCTYLGAGGCTTNCARATDLNSCYSAGNCQVRAQVTHTLTPAVEVLTGNRYQMY